jgi:hypothetical protein
MILTKVHLRATTLFSALCICEFFWTHFRRFPSCAVWHTSFDLPETLSCPSCKTTKLRMR